MNMAISRIVVGCPLRLIAVATWIFQVYVRSSQCAPDCALSYAKAVCSVQHLASFVDCVPRRHHLNSCTNSRSARSAPKAATLRRSSLAVSSWQALERAKLSSFNGVTGKPRGKGDRIWRLIGAADRSAAWTTKPDEKAVKFAVANFSVSALRNSDVLVARFALFVIQASG